MFYLGMNVLRRVCVYIRVHLLLVCFLFKNTQKLIMNGLNIFKLIIYFQHGKFLISLIKQVFKYNKQ